MLFAPEALLALTPITVASGGAFVTTFGVAAQGRVRWARRLPDYTAPGSLLASTPPSASRRRKISLSFGRVEKNPER